MKGRIEKVYGGRFRPQTCFNVDFILFFSGLEHETSTSMVAHRLELIKAGRKQ